MTITGSNFTGTTGVTLDGTPATSFTVVDATHLTAVAPAHIAGAADVRVTTSAGSSQLGVPFTFTAAPTSATPALVTASRRYVAAASGIRVTLTGTGFTPGMVVRFGLVPSMQVTVTVRTVAGSAPKSRAVRFVR